jgi:hypothetical protein
MDEFTKIACILCIFFYTNINSFFSALADLIGIPMSIVRQGAPLSLLCDAISLKMLLSKVDLTRFL